MNAAEASGGQDDPAEACFAWPPGPPLQGEGLLGWLVREASDQHLPNIGLILARATTRSNLRVRQRVGSRLDVQALADATMTTPQTISDLLYPDLDDERVRFLGAGVPRWHLESRKRRFSPATLAAEGKALAVWEHKFLPYCPVSWEYLTDRCCDPSCTARQTWHWATGVNRCPRCGAGLSMRPRRSVPPQWQARLTLVAALTAGREPSSLGQAIPQHLHQADPGDVLALIHSLFPLCGERPLTISTSRWWQRRPVRLARTLADAAGLLEYWPTKLLARLATVGGRRAAGANQVGAVLKGRTLRDGNPAAVLLANLRDAMRTHGPGRLAGSDSAYSVKTATLLLGSGTAIVVAKRRRGLLRTSPMLRSGELVLGLDRADVDAVVDLLAHRLSTWKVASRLGLPRYAVEDLVGIGLLANPDHPYMLDRYGSDAYDSRQVEELVRSLEASCALSEGTGVPIRTVMQSIGGRLKPWATILSEILEGSLAVRVEDGMEPIIERINVDEGVTGDFLSALPVAGSMDASRVVNRGDAIEVLNLKTKHYKALADVTGNRTAIPVAEIAGLARKYISPTEITARWGVEARIAAALIRREYPHVERQALGWPRAEIEAIAEEVIAAAR